MGGTVPVGDVDVQALECSTEGQESPHSGEISFRRTTFTEELAPNMPAHTVSGVREKGGKMARAATSPTHQSRQERGTRSTPSTGQANTTAPQTTHATSVVNDSVSASERDTAAAVDGVRSRKHRHQSPP